jgi:hypothetical protein
VLRRRFGPKKVEGTGEWRILHNEELNDLYYLPNIIRAIKSSIMIRAGRPERKRTLGRSRRRWEDNIKMDLQEVGWDV